MTNCRACLATANEMIRMDDDFVYNYNILTNLDVKTTDSLCQFVCETCLQSVKFFLEFRQKCILSEETLRSTYKAIKCENDGNVKKEYEVDFLDDSFLDTLDFNESSNVDIKNNDGSNADIKESVGLNVNIKTEHDYDNSREILIKIQSLRPKRKCVKAKVNKSLKNVQARGKVKQSQKKLQSCGQVMKLQKSLESSVRVKKLRKNIQHCGLCPKEFEDKNALSEHFEDHKTIMKCQICNLSFEEWPVLLSHRLEHIHGVLKFCHLCPNRFTSVQNYEVHLRKKHFDQENYRVQCTVCTKTYENRRKLKKHINLAHSGKTYICDLCNKVFTSRNCLKVHLITHSDKKRYFCDLCDFSCKLRNGIKQHTIRRHVPGRIICDNCQQPFADQKHLDMHKCKDRAVQICPVCGVQLSRSMRLRTHMQTHMEVGRFKCPLCPKVYKFREGLKIHMDRHDNNPRKHCEFCPAKFFQSSALIKHRRIHTGEKPYVCQICQKGFTGNHNLKVHMKVHGIHNLINKRVKPDEIPDET